MKTVSKVLILSVYLFLSTASFATSSDDEEESKWGDWFTECNNIELKDEQYNSYTLDIYTAHTNPLDSINFKLEATNQKNISGLKLTIKNYWPLDENIKDDYSMSGPFQVHTKYSAIKVLVEAEDYIDMIDAECYPYPTKKVSKRLLCKSIRIKRDM